MSDLNVANLELVLSALREKVGPIAESLNQCFDVKTQLSLGDSLPWSAAAPGPLFNGPGLIVSITVGDAVMLCALSTALPLPDWLAAPNASQKSRLDTLAMEWSMNCLPDDLAADSSSVAAVPNLKQATESAQPNPEGMWLPVQVSLGSGEPAEHIWLIWPAAKAVEAPAAAPAPASAARAAKPPEKAPANPAPAAAAPHKSPENPVSKPHSPKVERLLPVSVPVIVTLAERKIELGQLLSLGLGAIVTFDKSCEELLDLYVNNQLLCRGEAVKIGEKFGIKIAQVGVHRERVSAVLGNANI
jgi:flagellar motor switch protein FliN